jgi:hypothetical protein
LIKSRSFSTAVSDAHRPSIPSTSSSKQTRQFNTSRALKAVNDSSTVDFAYLPAFEDGATSSTSSTVRVPLAPDSSAAKYETSADVDANVHKPQINTVAADVQHAHMTEVHDFSDAPGKYHGFADAVAGRDTKLTEQTERVGSEWRRVWEGFLDDLLGPKTGARAS